MTNWNQLRLRALTPSEIYAEGDRLLGSSVAVYGMLLAWEGETRSSDLSDIVFPGIVVEMLADYRATLSLVYTVDFMPEFAIPIEDGIPFRRMETGQSGPNFRLASKYFLAQPVVANGTLVMTSDKSGVPGWRYGLADELTGGLLNSEPDEPEEVLLF